MERIVQANYFFHTCFCSTDLSGLCTDGIGFVMVVVGLSNTVMHMNKGHHSVKPYSYIRHAQ